MKIDLYHISNATIASSQDRERVYSELYARKSENASGNPAVNDDDNQEELFAEIYWHDKKKCTCIRIFSNENNSFWDFTAGDLLKNLIKGVIDIEQ